MSYFTQSGDAYWPTAGKENLLDGLPVGNYVVAQSQMGLFYQKVAEFGAPGKLYGSVEARAQRILNTFKDRPRATGALFAGEKGSGKSLLARYISYKGYELGIPTILVNAPYGGDPFSELLAKVEQPAIVLMDEFEKVYDREQQESVLTLLDGTMTSKKLFILTVNDKYRVDTNMKNRPGRLFYAIDFDGLESSFVREYCEDNLDNQEHTDAVVRISTIFQAFNFDMLKALIEEMNRYQEDPYEAMELLNANPMPQYGVSVEYTAKVWDKDGKDISFESETFSETPITARNGAMWVACDNDQSGIVLNASEVTKMDGEKGLFEFTTRAGYKVVFTKKSASSYDLRSLTY